MDVRDVEGLSERAEAKKRQQKDTKMQDKDERCNSYPGEEENMLPIQTNEKFFDSESMRFHKTASTHARGVCVGESMLASRNVKSVWREL